jgi:hypothetical protein
MGRITTPLLKLPLTKIVIKVNIKRYPGVFISFFFFFNKYKNPLRLVVFQSQVSMFVRAIITRE